MFSNTREQLKRPIIRHLKTDFKAKSYGVPFDKNMFTGAENDTDDINHDE